MVEISQGGEGTVLITFRLPHVVGADEVCVVGEFNDWSESANPMARQGDESVATIRLTPGQSYRFRHLLDGERWENDWNADAYVRNEFGGDDSVIDLTDAVQPDREVPEEPERARKRAPSKEAQ